MPFEGQSTLIWVDFLGVRFKVEGGGKTTPVYNSLELY